MPPAFAFGLAALALAAGTALAQAPAAPETRRIVLANRHLAPVEAVYLSPASDSDWGPERLGGTPLPTGGDTTIEMRGGCEADLRILFPNGGAEERRAVDICETTRIVLRPGWVIADALDEEGPVPPAVAEPAPTALTLRNAGRLPVVELYTFAAGSARGEDRLGADTLPIGATIAVEPAEPNACAVELVAVFRDGREVMRSGVDLCAGDEMEIR